MPYRIICKGGFVETDDSGRIYKDRLGRVYDCEPHDSWRVVGFTTRCNGNHLISLSVAASGADLGQGWVHDVDHGTRRMWAMPKNRRAVKVERI